MLDLFPLPQGHYPLDQVGTVGGWPISSYFGARPNPFTGRPSWHGGEDLVAPRETPIYAPVAGTVAQGWDSGGGGNWTTLYADDGRRYGFGHAASYADGVNGRHVAAGELLAYSNSTGASTGDHLHFAMAYTATGPWQDPYDELAECAAGRRFAGVLAAPPMPLPNPENLPELHPTPDPRKALITMQYWKIAGEDALYRVDVEPFLNPAATPRDPAQTGLFVGGEYAYMFPNPAGFALDAGIGVSAIELNPADPNHAPLVDELRKLPRITQAA